MIVLVYLGSQCTKFHLAGWMCWFFTHFYLVSCSWPSVIWQWIRETNSVKFCTNLGKSAMETLALIRQAFREESMIHTWKIQTHRDWKRRGRRRAKSRACSSFSLMTSRRFITKNSSWQAIPHTTVTFYGNCMIMCEVFTLNFGDERTGCFIMTMHYLTLPFSPGIFFLTRATWLLSPTYPTFLCFPSWR
jgi:hypothetical protein